jgi:hypothetical protein
MELRFFLFAGASNMQAAGSVTRLASRTLSPRRAVKASSQQSFSVNAVAIEEATKATAGLQRTYNC